MWGDLPSSEQMSLEAVPLSISQQFQHEHQLTARIIDSWLITIVYVGWI